MSPPTKLFEIRLLSGGRWFGLKRGLVLNRSDIAMVEGRCAGLHYGPYAAITQPGVTGKAVAFVLHSGPVPASLGIDEPHLVVCATIGEFGTTLSPAHRHELKNKDIYELLDGAKPGKNRMIGFII